MTRNDYERICSEIGIEAQTDDEILDVSTWPMPTWTYEDGGLGKPSGHPYVMTRINRGNAIVMERLSPQTTITNEYVARQMNAWLDANLEQVTDGLPEGFREYHENA